MTEALPGCAFPSKQRDNDTLFIIFVAASIAVHGIVFVAIPLAVKLFSKPVAFERPRTFQVVNFTPPQEAPAPAARAQTKKTKPGATPKPAKDKGKAKPKPQEPENVDELNDLLNDIPAARTELSAVGDFKYNWYLQAVSQKTERFWQPSSEKKDVFVAVSFTIFSDGSISEAKVAQSSGDPSLDDMAVRAVRLAAPFGKLPPGFSENRLDLSCTFRPTRK